VPSKYEDRLGQVGKGITLTKEELRALKGLLEKVV
jgi:hypothetical protein